MTYYSVKITTRKGNYIYPVESINSDAACIYARLEHALKGRPPVQIVGVKS